MSKTSLLALTLTTAGCASTPGIVAHMPDADASGPMEMAGTPTAPWWRTAGDPVLAALVEQGLSANPELACRLQAMRRWDSETAASARSLGGTLQRLFSKQADAREQAERRERVQRLAQRRVAIALNIALAYVELRRLQTVHSLRAGLLDQYRDNAQIAEFRREAGLVPAIDGALARSQDETVRAELGYDARRIENALAELARLTGLSPDILATRIGEPAAMPLPAGQAPAGQAYQREAALTEALDQARRAVKDARTAYREGAGTFATLYVAEAAALAVERALVDARAERAGATIRQWSGSDMSWASADMEGAAPSLVLPADENSDATADDGFDCGRE